MQKRFSNVPQNFDVLIPTGRFSILLLVFRVLLTTKLNLYGIIEGILTTPVDCSCCDFIYRDSNSRFAFTRQSSALLEKIVVCVNHTEPVLLVGETGTGKTSVIQYIAKQTGNKPYNNTY